MTMWSGGTASEEGGTWLATRPPPLLPHSALMALSTHSGSAGSVAPSTAALLSFLADLPRYPRHLYARNTQPADGSRRAQLTSPHSAAAALVLAASSNRRTTDDTTHCGADDESQHHTSHANRHAAAQRHHSSQQQSHSADVAFDESTTLLHHRPLVGKAETFEPRQPRQRHQQPAAGSDSAAAAITPLDFHITQQAQRRHAAAQRREQIKWRQQRERMEAKYDACGDEQCGEAIRQHASSMQTEAAGGPISRLIVPHARRDERGSERNERNKERQAAKEYAARRRTEQQQAGRQWEQQTAAVPPFDITIAEAETDPSGHQSDESDHDIAAGSEASDEQTELTTDRADALTADRRAGQQEETVAESASPAVQAASEHSPQQQRQQSPALPASSPSGTSAAPVLSVAFLLSCLPASCAAMEWSALCLSFLPIRPEPLNRMANFLSAAHSVVHILTIPPHKASGGSSGDATGSKRPFSAGHNRADADALSIAWLSGLIALPNCAFQPLHEIIAPSQQQTQPANTANTGGDTDSDYPSHPVYASLMRHYSRLCEWRWRRQPSVDQLLHLLHVVAYKAEVDARTGQTGASHIATADDSDGRLKPVQRFSDTLRTALSERRKIGTSSSNAASSPAAPSSSSRPSSRSGSRGVQVTAALFASLFSCLFALSSYPQYRSTAAVCASIDRVLYAVLPVTAEEGAKQQRLRDQAAARTAEIERRAEKLRLRACQAAEAEQRALQRLEERRQREAAILALHPRAGEWSAAAASGTFARTLPPHPLPPLSLG